MQRYGWVLAHMSLTHCSKLHSPQVNGSGEDDDDDDDDGLSIVTVVAMFAPMIRRMLTNKITERTKDCLYSAGITLKRLDPLRFLGELPVVELLSDRLFPIAMDRSYSFSFSGDMYTVVASSSIVGLSSMDW